MIAELGIDEVEAADAGYVFSPDRGGSFPCRGRGIRVPRLEELLARWPDVRLNIDPETDGCVEPLASPLDRLRAWDRVCIGSFSDRRLRRIRNLGRGRACTSMGPHAVALAGSPPHRAGSRVSAPTAFRSRCSGDRFRSSPSDSSRPHRARLPVHVWTINDKATIEHLLDLGVDGIMSDRLRLLADVLAHYRQARQ